MQDDVKTFLMFCETNDAAMMALCLSANPALVNAKDASGTPALHLAVQWAALEAVDLLLRHDVDVKATDAQGETAADLATRLNFTPLAGQLSAHQSEKDKTARAATFRSDFEKAITGFKKGSAALAVPKHKYKWKR